MKPEACFNVSVMQMWNISYVRLDSDLRTEAKWVLSVWVLSHCKPLTMKTVMNREKYFINTAKATTPEVNISESMCFIDFFSQNDSCPLDILFQILNRAKDKCLASKEYLEKNTKPEQPSVFFRVAHSGLVHQSPAGTPDCVSDSPSWQSCPHDQCGCRSFLSHFNLWWSTGEGSPVCFLWK